MFQEEKRNVKSKLSSPPSVSLKIELSRTKQDSLDRQTTGTLVGQVGNQQRCLESTARKCFEFSCKMCVCAVMYVVGFVLCFGVLGEGMKFVGVHNETLGWEVSMELGVHIYTNVHLYSIYVLNELYGTIQK